MIVIVAGVSGSGKTTVGALLADRLGWPFTDGDDLHPAANVAKMRAGIPLADADRLPWLRAIAAGEQDEEGAEQADRGETQGPRAASELELEELGAGGYQHGDDDPARPAPGCLQVRS